MGQAERQSAQRRGWAQAWARAMAIAVPVELANYFVVGTPAGSNVAKFGALSNFFGFEWTVLHVPGLMALDRFAFMTRHPLFAEIFIFACGLADTWLLAWLCIVIWRAVRRGGHGDGRG